MAQLKTLVRWSKVMGPLSLLNAARLLRSGRTGGDANLNAALTLRARGIPLKIYARPRTDDLLVFLEIFFEGEYQRAGELIKEPIGTVLDLGSNIGCSIAYFFTLFPKASYLGIEPSKNNLDMAARTLAPLINNGHAQLVQAFAGARPRLATIGRGGSGGSNELYLIDDLPSENADAIPVVTIPQLMDRYNLGRALRTIDLLKCDIEGGERELFEDCAAWIGHVRWMVVELHEGLTPEWLLEQTQAGGAEFQVLDVREKGPGVCVAWLKRV